MEELVTNVLNLKAEVNYLKGVVNKLVAESRKNKFMESNVLEADCPTDSALWEFLKNAAGGGKNIYNLKKRYFTVQLFMLNIAYLQPRFSRGSRLW